MNIILSIFAVIFIIAFSAHMLLVMLIALSKIFKIDEPIMWAKLKNKGL